MTSAAEVVEDTTVEAVGYTGGVVGTTGVGRTKGTVGATVG